MTYGGAPRVPDRAAAGRAAPRLRTRRGLLSRVAVAVCAGLVALLATAPLRADDPPDLADLAGVVTGRGAGPLEHVGVAAVPPQGVAVPPDVRIAAGTDADGRFRIAGLPRAAYRLRVTRPGGTATIHGPYDAGAGEIALEIDVGGVIRGRVVARDGGGVPGVVVLAAGTSGAPGNSTTTDLDGAFVLTDLRRGASYRVETGALPRVGAGPAPRAAADGVAPDGAAVALEADVGDALDGVVVDAAGSPLPGCLVRAADRRAEVPGVPPILELATLSGTTDRQGRFRIVAVPPGRYRLGVTEVAHRQALVRTTGGDDVPAGTRGVRLVVDTGGIVRGDVVDEDGTPVVAAIRAVPGDSGSPVRIGGSGRDGSFEIAGLDVRWGHRVTACRPGLVPVTVEGVRPGGDGLRLVLRRGLSFSGRVRRADGSPGARLPVVLDVPGAEDGAWGGAQDTTTDDEGRFSFRGLAAGRVRVSVALAASATRTRTSGSADATAGADDVEIVVEDSTY